MSIEELAKQEGAIAVPQSPEEQQFRLDTTAHIVKVQEILNQFTTQLHERGVNHDASKFSMKEAPLFAKHTAELSTLTYMSPEYLKSLDNLKLALNHHYKENRHHPEYHIYKYAKAGTNVVRQANTDWMNLIDVMEMLADWRAASLRHADGDIMTSIEKNQERFGYDNGVKELMKNTARFCGWLVN